MKKINQMALAFAIGSQFLTLGDIWAARRTQYFSGLSVNNGFKHPMSEGGPHVLLCGIQVVNISGQSQKISFTLYNQTTTQRAALSDLGSYTQYQELRTIGYEARRSYTDDILNIAYQVVNYNGAAGNWTSYYNDTSNASPYTPTRLAAGTVTASGISLPNNSMLWIMARSHISPKDAIITENKGYNFCLGSITAADVGTEGSVLATGYQEYMADTPLYKYISFGGSVTLDSVMQAYTSGSPVSGSYVRVSGNGTYGMRVTYDRTLAGAVAAGRAEARCDINPSATMAAAASCSSVISNPQSFQLNSRHIASSPIIINGGRPF